ncbi:hypothetical protein MRX96_011131 [Rhipicephalus microplus]
MGLLPQRGLLPQQTGPSHEATPGQPYPPSHSFRIPLKERTPADNTDRAKLGLNKKREGRNNANGCPKQWWPTSKAPSRTAHTSGLPAQPSVNTGGIDKKNPTVQPRKRVVSPLSHFRLETDNLRITLFKTGAVCVSLRKDLEQNMAGELEWYEENGRLEIGKE